MLKQAQILAKVKYWTATVAAKLCSNLCVCLNFLALWIKIKSRKIVNNYNCRLNKQDSKAKLPLFKVTFSLFVTHGSEMTVNPRGGKNKNSSYSLSIQAEKGEF